MSRGWNFLLTEASLLAIAALMFVAYQSPTRNRATRAIDGYWQWWLKRPTFGFSLFKTSRGVSLFQAILMVSLAAFLLVMYLANT